MSCVREPLEFNIDGFEATFKYTHRYFHLLRGIPSIVPSDDPNISRVDAYVFSTYRSLQNVQFLRRCNGVLAYGCKYIGKIDDQIFL